MIRGTVFAVAAMVAAAVSPVADAQDSQVTRDIVRLINAERTHHALGKLRYDRKLEQAARAHAQWMARNGRMEHLQRTPTSLEEWRTGNHHPCNRVVNAGYFAWDDLFTVETTADAVVLRPKPAANESVGEIIAKASHAGPPATQPPRIVTGWMNSPGHRHAILTPGYEELGVATAVIGPDVYWCVVFGTPKK